MEIYSVLLHFFYPSGFSCFLNIRSKIVAINFFLKAFQSNKNEIAWFVMIQWNASVFYTILYVFQNSHHTNLVLSLQSLLLKVDFVEMFVFNCTLLKRLILSVLYWNFCFQMITEMTCIVCIMLQNKQSTNY